MRMVVVVMVKPSGIGAMRPVDGRQNRSEGRQSTGLIVFFLFIFNILIGFTAP